MSSINQINNSILTNQQATTVVEGFADYISIANSTTSVTQDAADYISSVDSHILSSETNSDCEFLRKLGQTFSEWVRYEQSLSEHAKKTQNVLNDDCLLVSARRDELIIKIRSAHDEWINMRKQADFSKKIGLTPYPATIQIPVEGKLNSKQRIIAKSTKEKFDKAVKEALADLPSNKRYKNALINDDFIEIKVIQILIYINSVIAATNVDQREICDIWFGFGKFIFTLESIQLHDGFTNDPRSISQLLMNDLRNKYNQFVERFHASLSYNVVSANFAELFLKTSFDKILPGCSLKPYTSQKEFLRFINDNINRSFVCVYNTIMGSGKTSVVASLAKLLHRMDKTKTLIYVCPEGLSAVREMVGSLLYNFQINFAIASIEDSQRPDGTYKVSIDEQNICRNIETKPTVILTGVVTMIEMLKRTIKKQKNPKKRINPFTYYLHPEDYVVFFDENTVTLDSQSSPMVKYLSEFYRLMPSQVIFSSATHLPIEELDRLREYITSQRPETVFTTIDYSEVKIGTQLFRMNGQNVIPHSECTTVEQLTQYINKVRNNLMYKKFYTYALVNSMYNRLVELGFGSEIPHEYHYNTYMDAFPHRNQESIQDLGIIYLELVVLFCSEEYEMFRMFSSRVGLNNLIELFNANHSQVGHFSYDRLHDCIRNKVLKGQTFVSCSNPYQEMMSKFGVHLELVKQRIGYQTFSKLVTDYKNKKERVEKEAESRRKSTKQGDKMSKLERDRADAMITSSISDAVIPLELGLNGVTLGLNNITSDNITASEEYDNLLLAAMIGIVVYRKSSNIAYHDMVKKLISDGNCSVVFADSSLNYGNSFPFNNGIILDEMSHHSANTLLQLIGRAGRVGLSSYANIYAGDRVCHKLFEPVYNPNYVDWEKINMNKCVRMAVCKDYELLDLKSSKDFKSNLTSQDIVIQECFLNYIQQLEQRLIKHIESVLLHMNGQQQIILRNELEQFNIDHDIFERSEGVVASLQELLLSRVFMNSEELREIITVVEKYRNNISNAEIMTLKVLNDEMNLMKDSLNNMYSKFVNSVRILSDDIEIDNVHTDFNESLSELLNETCLPLQQQVQMFVEMYREKESISETFTLLLDNIDRLVTKFDQVKVLAQQELDMAKSNAVVIRREHEAILQREREAILQREREAIIEREREATLEREREAARNTPWTRVTRVEDHSSQFVQSTESSQRPGIYVPPRGGFQRSEPRGYENSNGSNSSNWRGNIQIPSDRNNTNNFSSSSANLWR
jgi:hypothetical protein